MKLYHVTTPKKAALYRASGRIIAPVRGFDTFTGALAWACKVGRKVILEASVSDMHLLPDHHNAWGNAYWTPDDVTEWSGAYDSEADA